MGLLEVVEQLRAALSSGACSTSPFASAEADIAQAQRYASDLARLMIRRTRHAGEGPTS